MATYVVKVARSYAGSPEVFDEFLVAIQYDPYCTGDRRSHSTSSNRDGAFKFETRAAAELAAVFVGGRVE